MSGSVNSLIPLQNTSNVAPPTVEGVMRDIAGGQQIGMAPAKAMQAVQQIQLGQQELQQNQQTLEGQNALRNIFADPASLDPKTGLPTGAALAKVMAADPGAGMKMQQFMQNSFNTQFRQKVAALNFNDAVQEQFRGTNTDAMRAYNQALEANHDPKAAQEAAQTVYGKWREGLESSGLVSPEQLAAIPRTFSPATAVMTDKYYADQDARRREEKTGWGIYEDVLPDGTRTAIRYNPQTGKATTATGEPYDIRGKVEKDQKEPSPGSPAATHVAVMNDLKNDPAWANATPGALALEAKRQEGIAAGTVASPDSIRETAEQIATYQAAPLTNFAMARPGGQAIMAEVRRINPDYQSTYYRQFSNTMSKFGAGTEGNRVRFLNVAVQHLDVLNEAVNNLGNSDVRVLNSVRQRMKAATGVDAPVTFDAVKSIVGTEIEKAVAGGIGAVADRDRLLEGLSRANSPAQLKGVIAAYKSLMAGQAMGLKAQYEQSTPDTPLFRTGRMSFDSKLLPTTQKELGLIGGKERTTPPPTGAIPAPPDFPASLRGRPVQMNRDKTQYRDSSTGEVFDLTGKPVSAAAPAQPTTPTDRYPVSADQAQDPDGTKYKGSDGKTYVKQGQFMVPLGAAPAR